MTFSACDGRTEVCSGSLQAYRDSDAGHNLNNLFHAAHLALANRWPNSVVISLHGMKEDSEGVKTSLIVSNGARAADVEQKTAATKFRSAVAQMIGEAGMVVSCNVPADSIYNYRPLCGYTNVQGRHVNGDDNACHGSVEVGTGRFIHMEQDWSILQRYAEGWSGIDGDRVNSIFIEGFGSVLPEIDK